MENRVTWNDALTISCPEGFHVLDEAERGKLNFIQDGPGGGISDPERHILISVGWKPFGGLSAMLLGIKDVAKSMEGRVRKPMQNYGYRLDGFVSGNVGNEKAEGFRYEYEADRIRMYAESYVVKYKKVLYFLHFYARRELKDESLEIWNEILLSAKWG